MFLQEFDFTIRYIDGKRNNVADFLTRNPSVEPLCGGCAKRLRVSRVSILKDQGDRYRAAAARDENMQKFEEWRAGTIEMTKAEKLYYRLLSKEGDYWYFRRRLIVPRGELQTELLEQFHDLQFSGHQGIKRSREKLSRGYYWLGMDQDVEDFVKSCDTCQRFKERSRKKLGLLQSLKIPDDKFQDISMDFCDAPKTKGGDQLLIIVDRLSKMVKMVQCFKTDSAERIASLFVNTWFRLFGLPKSITSDRDPKFTSKVWSAVCKILQIKQELTTARHQNANGQAEIMIRTIKRTIKKFMKYKASNWDDLVGLIEFAINDSLSLTTGFTPFYLTYGVHPQTVEQGMDMGKFTWGDWMVEIRNAIREAKVNIKEKQEQQKKQFDKHRREENFQVGDLVWLESEGITWNKNSEIKKIELPKWLGPFKILKAWEERGNFC
jgi:hypothetical protein